MKRSRSQKSGRVERRKRTESERKAKKVFERISVNPQVLGGKPCVKGTRIAVYMVLELLEESLTFDEIIRDYYPQLTREDVAACVEYARAVVEQEEVHFAEELVKT